jgi:hypothetical protein
MRDRGEPSLWDAILFDPVLPFDAGARRLLVRDQQRWTRRYLHPVASVVSRVAVALIRVAKHLVPVRSSGPRAGRAGRHRALDRLCLWFLRRFVSPDAVHLLIRHFVVETNLLNFIVRNSGAEQVPEVGLMPTTLAELGDGAVIQHDVNVYNVVVDLGTCDRSAVLRPRRVDELDFSPLRVPPIDPEPGTRRLLQLDIETALCLMNIPFALLTTADEYRRAVNSLQLDETLLACLTAITGDPTFLAWRPDSFPVRLETGRDVPRDVYGHAVICEYAHTWLCRLRDARDSEGPRSGRDGVPPRSARPGPVAWAVTGAPPSR